MNRTTAMTARIVTFCMIGLWLLSAGSPAGAQTVGNRIGIDIHEPTAQDIDTILDRVVASGMKWVRVDFNWLNMQPGPNTYSWTPTDRIVQKANQRGINVYPSVAYAPTWSSGGPMWSGVPQTADWTNFLTKVVQRYPTITNWGIWNEPNLTDFWSGTRQQYIDVILKPGSDAIHAANPNAKVVGPELAHLVSGDRNWENWLNDILTQASDKMDILSHHSYGSNSTINRNLEGWLFGNGLKDVLDDHGWNKPVWLTEVGWMSGDYGLQGQADNYTTMLNQWMTENPNRNWLDKIFFFEMAHGAPDFSYSIVNDDLSPKPAYYALQSFIAAHTVPEPALGMTMIMFVSAYMMTVGGRGRRRAA
ncbi:MAG: hypothetical protein IT447_13275 [Phycisphaerales bacterium]|jgi:hypothetical protein|nr:hypothetical protein [Phycisphaerales bacterium]